MAAGNKNKTLGKTSVESITEPIENNLDNSQPVTTYFAVKTIYHNGKIINAGEEVTAIKGSELERLIKLKSVVENTDEFPRFN